MELSKRETGRVLAALAIAEEWEASLMDANRHTQDGEYAKARERRRQYRELLCRLKERMFKDKANR